MEKPKVIENFSKLTRDQMISFISELTENPLNFITTANIHLNEVEEIQNRYKLFLKTRLQIIFYHLVLPPIF
jgi:hypothetical protein